MHTPGVRAGRPRRRRQGREQCVASRLRGAILHKRRETQGACGGRLLGIRILSEGLRYLE